MDPDSFDRLSVVVHRLRERATRRGALGLLVGGAVAAVAAVFGDDAEAKRRGRNRNRSCRGFGGSCRGDGDCCSRNCINNRCYNVGGGGGGRRCDGRTCPADWKCCKSGSTSVCVPNTYPTCCGGNSYVPGYLCCSGSTGGACPVNQDCCGSFGQCCQPGWKCCGNGRCCPDNWTCGALVCEFRQNATFSSESMETMAFAEPETISPDDWIEITPP